MFKSTKSWVLPAGVPGSGLCTSTQKMLQVGPGNHSWGSPRIAHKGPGTQRPAVGAPGQEHRPGVSTGFLYPASKPAGGQARAWSGPRVPASRSLSFAAAVDRHKTRHLPAAASCLPLSRCWSDPEAHTQVPQDGLGVYRSGSSSPSPHRCSWLLLSDVLGSIPFSHFLVIVGKGLTGPQSLFVM